MNDPIEIKNLDKKSGVKKNKPVNIHLPQVPFSWILIGPSGSGKSNLLLNVIELYAKHFKPHHRILISPSLGLDPKTSMIEADWRYAEFNPDIIKSVIDQQREIMKKKPKKVPEILIILDDCISEPGAFNQKGALEKLFYRCRHFHCSLLITSQKYSSLSRGIRLNSKTCSFFRPYNESEKEHILKEHADKKTKDRMNNMLENVWAQPYHFVQMDYTKLDPKMRYQRCLSEFIDLNAFKKDSSEEYKNDEYVH